MELPNNKIKGVIFKQLVSHADGRGFFREIFKDSEEIFTEGKFAQWSHSKMQKHVVKAWHYHHKQTDWWYIPMGSAEVVLYDNREESPTYKEKISILMGEQEYEGTQMLCVKIPPGVLHACEVKSDYAHLFYITSEEYDPNDEGRIAFDSTAVPHTWTEHAIVSKRDTKDFIPQYKRKLID